MGIVVATLIGLGVIASVLAQDIAILSWAYWQQEGGSDTSRSEVFRNFGLFFAAGIALVFAFWRARIATKQADAAAARADAAIEQARAANEQARTAEQGHITERFSRAVEQLGSEQLPVRLGGIYTLWRLIKDSPKRDVISVIDILCAFVRHPPHRTGPGPVPDASEDGRASAEKVEKAGSATKIRPDVQTVLDRIGTKNAVYRALLPAGYRLDLTGANLRFAKLTGADLTLANLTGADLTRANLTDADLTGASLMGADLTGAILLRANLTSAGLISTNLTSAILMYANLMGASLANANLTNATVMQVNLTNAELEDANLTGASLSKANFTDANLSKANFTGVKDVTQNQLDSACIVEGGAPPSLPEGSKPPQNICPPRIVLPMWIQ